jgi:hypothetical protein
MTRAPPRRRPLLVKDTSGNVDQIIFSGTHTLANFRLANGGNGGTLITDPPIDNKAYTVTNGVNIAVFGNYIASSFAATSDGHWGTLATDASAHANLQPLLALPHA